MTYVSLFFVGAVYFINGLSLLGRIDSRSSASINVIIGGLLLAVAGWILLPLNDLGTSSASMAMFSSVGVVLFAITFLMVGIGNYTNDSAAGFGWYCGWATFVSVCIALLDIFRYGDLKGASLWLVWTAVFGGLFILGILKIEKIRRPTGWFFLVAGFTTCFIPGALGEESLGSTEQDAG